MQIRIVLAAVLLLLAGSAAQAQNPVTLEDVTRKAITENPEVQASWHSFLAATEEQDVARGAYYPRLDLSAGTGWEKWERAQASDEEFTRSNVALSLRQMVYDGFATRSQVQRLGYAKLVRYYEVLASSERVGLEAMRAYLDVLRYRELQDLAANNFIEHQNIFQKVQERVQAGVSRGVDLEQAGGRLALAESNRLTEISNLYDVSTRYLRIVGQAPPAAMAPPELLSENLPSQLPEALEIAFQQNPSFNAAVENVRSARAEIDLRRAAFRPRVDVQARQDFGRGIDAIEGRRDETVVELVLNYNLFAGGSDRAAQRRAMQLLNVAREQREQTCRNIRQDLSIAFNDLGRLEEQLRYLNEHQLATAKAREAYRNQFDIGQRTLLDLLDTENEFFQARRAYVNATYDYALAHGRTLASMGRLLQALQVSRESLPSLQEVGQDRPGVDPDSICPVESVEKMNTAPPAPSQRTSSTLAPAAPPGKSPSSAPEVLLEKLPYRLKVEFAFDSAAIPPEYQEEIDRLAEFLRQHPDLELSIEGHTDNIGPAEYNQQLSQARAEAVSRSLTEKYGISAHRLTAVGFGMSRPITDNDTPKGRQLNRRVEAIAITK